MKFKNVIVVCDRGEGEKWLERKCILEEELTELGDVWMLEESKGKEGINDDTSAFVLIAWE